MDRPFKHKDGARWWEFGWQLIEGCTKVSPGCDNCWSLKKEDRFRKEMGIVFHDERLQRPLKRRKPSYYSIWNDLFHESIPFEQIDKVFAVMALCPQHTFQVLTKRADRMKEYLDQMTGDGSFGRFEVDPQTLDVMMGDVNDSGPFSNYIGTPWPLPNVWLGVTAENQEMADQRIPILLQTPAAVRFASCEPLLGEVDLESNIGGTLWIDGQRGCGGKTVISYQSSVISEGQRHGT